MKQHLKIKSFWGTSINADKIQMYSAIIAYCLVAINGNKLKVDRKIYELKIDGVKFYKFFASLYWIKLL
jgi:hypothetical protein